MGQCGIDLVSAEVEWVGECATEKEVGKSSQERDGVCGRVCDRVSSGRVVSRVGYRRMDRLMAYTITLGLE
jgi:hypothetical protein